MIKLIIKNIDNHLYYLKDDKNNSYEIIIEFQKLNEIPRINDYIHISKSLLNEKMITLGPLGSAYGRKMTNSSDDDIAILEIKGEKIYLQRYYG